MLGDIIPLNILSSIRSQCNSSDGDCNAGGITLFSVAIHEWWVKLWSLHRVRASLTTVVLSQMQSPYMKRLCTACYRWYTLRTWNMIRIKHFFGMDSDVLSSYSTIAQQSKIIKYLWNKMMAGPNRSSSRPHCEHALEPSEHNLGGLL